MAKSLGVSAYVIEPGFNFSNALIHAISIEGTHDGLDEIPVLIPRTSRSLTSPPSSSPSSPLSSPPSSPLPLPSSLPTSQLSSTPPSRSNAQKRKISRGKSHSKKNRKKRRQEASPKDAQSIPARKKPAEHFVPSGSAFEIEFSLEDDAPVASTSYIGLLDRGEEGEGRTWSLKELRQKGFSLSRLPRSEY